MLPAFHSFTRCRYLANLQAIARRVLASSPTIRLILATTTPVDEVKILALKNQSLEDYSKGGPSFAYARSPRGYAIHRG